MERIYQSPEIDSLAKALAKAQSEMKHATKDLQNEAFKRNGKATSYAGLDSVLDAARGALAKNGLSVVQPTDLTDDGRVVVMTQLTHETGQWMRSWYPVNPVQNNPQGLGSALTYSRRYAYMAMVGVAATDDDDDGNAASGQNGNPAQPETPRNAPPKSENNLEAYNQRKAQYAVECPVLPDGSLNYDAFGADLESLIAGAKDMNELSMFKKANAKTLNRMKEDRPEMFEAIKLEFTKYGNALA